MPCTRPQKTAFDSLTPLFVASEGGRQQQGKMRSVTLLAKLLFLALLTLPLAAAASQSWFLMARHGECAPVATLARVFPDIGNVADPEAFIRFARAKGLTVTSKSVPLQAGSAIEVFVPQRSLSLVFVTTELCSEFNGGPGT